MQFTRLCIILIASALMMTELATAAPVGSADISLNTRALDNRSTLRERAGQDDPSGKPITPIHAPDRSHEAVSYPGEIKKPPTDNGRGGSRFNAPPAPPPDRPLPPTPPRRDTTHGA
ncbi:hypothetical protein F5887DRAFT_1290297 [Amanita rubescens]|nr:hypothetical protein F5887DRAFT_1290297 [Amanita rubescens]